MAILSRNDINNRAFDLMTTAAESTGGHVSEFLREEDKPQKLREYKITEDKRTKIQRAADEFYESGPIGAAAAAVADILPGIPWVDIIDPPATLADPAAQKTRNILGALGLIGSIYKTPQAVGRVVTNIREPFFYGETLRRVKTAAGIKKPKDIPGGLWRAFKAVYKDEPLYNILGEPSAQRRHMNLVKRHASRKLGLGEAGILASDLKTPATTRGTEFLYRKMFGLKPRTGKNIFKLNKDGTYSFNPKSKYGRELIEGVLEAPATEHPVMRGYKRVVGESGISYEDIWDFKLHPGEAKRLVNLLMKGEAGQKEAVLGIRALVHPLTSPVHMKGKIKGGELSPYALTGKIMKKSDRTTTLPSPVSR